MGPATDNVMNAERAEYASAMAAVVRLQAWWRGCKHARQFYYHVRAAQRLQATWRRVIWMLKIAKWRKAGYLLTRWFRGTYWRRYGFHGNLGPFGATGPFWKKRSLDAPIGISTFTKSLLKSGVTVRRIVDPHRREVSRSKEHLLLGSPRVLNRCAVRIQAIQRKREIWHTFIDLLASIVRLQSFWRMQCCRSMFRQKLETEVRPTIESWECKIRLWNRLVQRADVSSRTRASVVVVLGVATDPVTKLLTRNFLSDASSCVILCDTLGQNEGNVIVDQLALGRPGSSFYFEANMSDPQSIIDTVHAINGQFGKIDFLVNSGVARSENMTNDSAFLSGQVLGPMVAFKAILSGLRESGGVLVNISPFEVLGGAPSLQIAATKAGFLALTNECAHHYPEMRINLICPVVHMGVRAGRKPIQAGIADLAKYLTSADAPFMSGQVLNVQGYV